MKKTLSMEEIKEWSQESIKSICDGMVSEAYRAKTEYMHGILNNYNADNLEEMTIADAKSIVQWYSDFPECYIEDLVPEVFYPLMYAREEIRRVDKLEAWKEEKNAYKCETDCGCTAFRIDGTKNYCLITGVGTGQMPDNVDVPVGIGFYRIDDDENIGLVDVNGGLKSIYHEILVW